MCRWQFPRSNGTHSPHEATRAVVLIQYYYDDDNNLDIMGIASLPVYSRNEKAGLFVLILILNSRLLLFLYEELEWRNRIELTANSKSVFLEGRKT